MYSVPLRRALVTGTDLPYPEGVAAAEVLKVGAGVGGVEENRRGLSMIVWSSLVAAGFAALAQTRLLVADAAKAFKFGSGATAASTSLSMAADRRRPPGRPGRRHRDVRRPADQLGVPRPPLHVRWPLSPRALSSATFVNDVFRNQVRFIGAGTIGVAAIWTLLRIIGPIIAGIRGALAANRERKAGRGDALPLTERDLPIGIVGGSILLSMIPIGAAAIRLRRHRSDRRRTRR